LITLITLLKPSILKDKKEKSARNYMSDTTTISRKYTQKTSKYLLDLIQVPEGENEKDYLKKFNNSVQRQFETGELEMTNLQVLQAHVKNWKSLTLRQRRVVTNLLHARRANEAKEEFLKELDLLGQKIAYDKAHQ